MPQIGLALRYATHFQKETGVKVYFKEKNTSKLMNLLGWFFKVTKINPNFKERYFTTVGNTIYYPKISESLTEEQFFSVIVHEMTHVFDYKQYGFLYVLAYLFPQWLGLVALLLGFITSGWWFLGLAFLAPLPAFGRFWFELRAFKSTYVLYDAKGKNLDDIENLSNHVVEQLSKNYYYYAWPFPKHIEKMFKDTKYNDSKIYSILKKFLETENVNNHESKTS